MPFNFLELSETYHNREAVERKERRNVVAEEADDEFFLRKRGRRIKDRMYEEGKKVPSDNEITQDGKILRTARQYLLSSAEEKERMRETARNTDKREYLGVRCLIEDGIEDWKDIIRLKEEREARILQKQKQAQEAAQRDAPKNEGASAEENIVRQEESRIELNDMVMQAGERMLQSVTGFYFLVDTLRAENRRFSSMVEHLNREVARLKNELERATENAMYQEEYAALLQEELDTIKRRTLQDLAMEHADDKRGRELIMLVQKMQAESALNERSQIPELPETMHDGRRMIYERRFMQDYERRSAAEKQRLLAALGQFSEQGERYSSFRTKQWAGAAPPGCPNNCFESWATDELRLIWKRGDDGAIHFYRTGRHPDFSSGEA